MAVTADYTPALFNYYLSGTDDAIEDGTGGMVGDLWTETAVIDGVTWTKTHEDAVQSAAGTATDIHVISNSIGFSATGVELVNYSGPNPIDWDIFDNSEWVSETWTGDFGNFVVAFSDGASGEYIDTFTGTMTTVSGDLLENVNIVITFEGDSDFPSSLNGTATLNGETVTFDSSMLGEPPVFDSAIQIIEENDVIYIVANDANGSQVLKQEVDTKTGYSVDAVELQDNGTGGSYTDSVTDITWTQTWDSNTNTTTTTNDATDYSRTEIGDNNGTEIITSTTGENYVVTNDTANDTQNIKGLIQVGAAIFDIDFTFSTTDYSTVSATWSATTDYVTPTNNLPSWTDEAGVVHTETVTEVDNILTVKETTTLGFDLTYTVNTTTGDSTITGTYVASDGTKFTDVSAQATFNPAGDNGDGNLENATGTAIASTGESATFVSNSTNNGFVITYTDSNNAVRVLTATDDAVMVSNTTTAEAPADTAPVTVDNYSIAANFYNEGEGAYDVVKTTTYSDDTLATKLSKIYVRTYDTGEVKTVDTTYNTDGTTATEQKTYHRADGTLHGSDDNDANTGYSFKTKYELDGTTVEITREFTESDVLGIYGTVVVKDKDGNITLDGAVHESIGVDKDGNSKTIYTAIVNNTGEVWVHEASVNYFGQSRDAHNHQWYFENETDSIGKIYITKKEDANGNDISITYSNHFGFSETISAPNVTIENYSIAANFYNEGEGAYDVVKTTTYSDDTLATKLSKIYVRTYDTGEVKTVDTTYNTDGTTATEQKTYHRADGTLHRSDDNDANTGYSFKTKYELDGTTVEITREFTESDVLGIYGTVVVKDKDGNITLDGAVHESIGVDKEGNSKTIYTAIVNNTGEVWVHEASVNYFGQSRDAHNHQWYFENETDSIGKIYITKKEDANGNDISITYSNHFGFSEIVTNTAPTLSDMTGHTAILTIDEDVAYVHDTSVHYEDVDSGDTATYSLEGSSWATIDSSTGEITGTPSNDNVGTETVSVTVTDAAGLAATTSYDLTVDNTNDAAIITVATDKTIAEGTVTVTGTATHTDVDANNDANVFTAATDVASTYGTYSVDTAGAWTYSLNSDNATIDALGDGQSTTDTITVAAEDGTTKDITVTINGTNDAAIITVATDKTIAEGTATVTGTATHTDVDANNDANVFTAATDVASTYGTYSVDTAGAWTYSLNSDNATIDALGDGQSTTDTITVTAEDGTTQDISIAITGTDDESTTTAQLIQVRNVEAMSQKQAADNEGIDPAAAINPNSTVVKFELWLDASQLSQFDANATEIYDFSFNIGWNASDLQALAWGVTGDQLALDNSFVSYNYNNANDMAITFNPDNNGVASIAFTSPTSVVDTLTPLFGADTKGSELLIATFYAAPNANIETIGLSIESVNVGSNLPDSFDLDNYSIVMDTSTIDATIQTDTTHYLDNISINYVDDEGVDTGVSSLVESGGITLDQSVDFDVVTLSDSSAYSSGVQTNDATAILRHIVGLDTLEDGSVNIHAADVNNNGTVQTNDATAILRHIVGLDTIGNFDLIDNSTGQRVTHLDGDSADIASLTIVENGDVNQSGQFYDDFTVQIDLA